MKVLLVNPLYRPIEFSLGLPVVENAFGAIPPMNLLYVAAALREAGADVSLLDAEARRIDNRSLVDAIVAARADVIGFTSTTFSHHQVLAVAREVRGRTDATICVGGRHTSYFAELIAQEDAFDYVSIGEIESSATALVELFAGSRTAADTPGIAYTADGRVVVNPPAAPPADLDALPFPARDLLENDRYFSVLSKWKNFTLMLSSRGCPCECIFCEVGRSALRLRSARNVVEEMEDANRRFGIREFDICDSDFCLDRNRVLELAERVGGRFHFSGRARVNDLSPEVVTKLAAGGCFRIHLGVESGVPAVLDALGKKSDLSRLPDSVRAARRANLGIVAYFMIGNPTETERQARETGRFSRSLPFSFIQFTRTFPLPNTVLYNRFVGKTGHEFWNDFYRTGTMRDVSKHLDSELDGEWIDRFINRSYLAYYLKPGAVVRAIGYFGVRRFARVVGLALTLLATWLVQARPRRSR